LEKLTLSELPALMLKAPVARLPVPAAVPGSSVPPETVTAPPTPLLPVRVAPEATVTEVLASVLPRKSVPPLRAIDPIVPPPLRFSVPVPLRVKVVAVSAPVWVRVPDTESWPLVSVVGQPLLTVVAEEVTPLPPLPATVRVLAPAQVRETALAPAPKTRVRVTALIVPLTRGLRRMALLGIVTSSARVGTLLVDQLAGLFHCRLAVPAQSMLAARTAGAASSTKASSDLPRSEVLMPALLLLEPRSRFATGGEHGARRGEPPRRAELESAASPAAVHRGGGWPRGDPASGHAGLGPAAGAEGPPATRAFGESPAPRPQPPRSGTTAEPTARGVPPGARPPPPPPPPRPTPAPPRCAGGSRRGTAPRKSRREAPRAGPPRHTATAGARPRGGAGGGRPGEDDPRRRAR